MEIVAETTLWGEYLAVVIVLVILSGVMVGLSVSFIGELKKHRDPMDFIFAVFSTIGALCALALVLGAFHIGPSEQYKAIVDDYNEVYEQGYEIVGREGELSILRESEAE